MKPFFTAKDLSDQSIEDLKTRLAFAIEWGETYSLDYTFKLIIEKAMHKANAKLEREGTVVYGQIIPGNTTEWEDSLEGPISNDTHKALLINPEPIEKRNESKTPKK